MAKGTVRRHRGSSGEEEGRAMGLGLEGPRPFDDSIN